MATTTPPRVPGYEVLGELARGGMGTVWRAVQLGTGRAVALKFLNVTLAGSDRARARFDREVKLAAQLEHPHVARVYESGVDRGMYYYAMELVEGLPLDRYVREQALRPRELLRLLRAVCRAVQHAHEHGVVHRDLKPGNILVTSGCQPKVLDFGLAEAVAETAGERRAAEAALSSEGEFAGTPSYASPEQAAGRPADARSDVYSLGVILYRLVVGDAPHEESGSQEDLLRRVSREPVRRPRAVRPDLDTDVEALLLMALAQDPAQRYPTARELAADIENYLTGRPLLAKRADPSPALDLTELLLFLDALQAGNFSAQLPGGLPGRAGEVVTRLHTLRDRLAGITSEVTRVAGEIAAEGRLGGWVDVLPPQGEWKRMVDAVNALGHAVTWQVRDVNKTLESVLRGELSRDVTVPVARGELLQQRQSINALLDRLRKQAAGILP